MAKGSIRLGAGHYHLFHLFGAIIAEHKGWLGKRVSSLSSPFLPVEYVKQAAGDINSRFGSRGFE